MVVGNSFNPIMVLENIMQAPTNIASYHMSCHAIATAKPQAKNNAELITDDIKAAIEDAKAKIISGEIQVAEYYATESCPVE